jgi:5-methyltetrahydropteroyltriglutamate--homocysteine methyltransferase
MKSSPLMTTTVGSSPRPRWLAQSEDIQMKFLLQGEALQEAMDEATALSIREEDFGLDIVTDGEQRRSAFIFHIAGTWSGADHPIADQILLAPDCGS